MQRIVEQTSTPESWGLVGSGGYEFPDPSTRNTRTESTADHRCECILLSGPSIGHFLKQLIQVFEHLEEIAIEHVAIRLVLCVFSEPEASQVSRLVKVPTLSFFANRLFSRLRKRLL